MPDLLFFVVTVAFFAVAAGFVSLCDRIIGPDSDHGDPDGIGELDAAGDDAAALAASGTPRTAVNR